jgi:HD-GYP domain-containing protein (c-di-GMP phosphodiesterase class II)
MRGDTASVSSSALPQLEPVSAADLDLEGDAAIEQGRARRFGGLGSRDLWATVFSGSAFLAVTIPFAILYVSDRAPSPLTIAALVLAYALAYRIEFEIGSGLAVPTGLVFVPMLFLLPLGMVPFAVAGGIMVANLVEHAEGQIDLERIFVRLANAWHAVGPVLVLALAGEQAPALGDWPVYAVAFAAQLAFEFGSVAVRERLALGISPRVLVGHMRRAWAVDATLAPVGLLAALAATEQPAAFLLVLPLAGLIQVFARERRARVDHALELSHAYRGTALLLGDVVEADDAYTGSHSRDVVSLTLGVADELRLDARGRRDAEFVALLHDVGKIRIPEEIINKPGKLTLEERAVIETHTVIGEEMLVRVGGVLGQVGRIVRSCHEHMDGGGYPDGLAGEEIPLVARIVCCCDAFSAMTTDRPYRAARTSEEALVELRRCAGTQFDPRVVDALERTIARDR